jgi:peptide deformylase
MRAAGGVGLAAPQVGVPLRIAVMEVHPTEWRPDCEHKGPLTIINPQIIEYGLRTSIDWEGCLSFLPLRGRVPRPSSVLVEYWTSDGELVRERATGLWARIFQHEIDHLDGIVYADRMTDMRSLMTLNEFQERVRGKK